MIPNTIFLSEEVYEKIKNGEWTYKEFKVWLDKMNNTFYKEGLREGNDPYWQLSI